MKIDGQNQLVDLIQRMQEAHDTAKTDGASFSLSEQVAHTSRVDSPTEAGLIDRLKETATKALDGGFKDAESVRLAVVEDIVDDKLADLVPKRSEKKKLIDGLQRTLVQDPEFEKQVDDMLIMAAREVGASR